MNHKERFLSALRKEIPDKVPLFDLEFNEASIVNLGKYFCEDLPPIKPMIDYSSKESEHLNDVFFKIVEGLDLDAANFIFGFGGKRINGKSDRFIDDMGVIYQITEHGDPFPIDGPVKTIKDLESIRWPSIESCLNHFDYWRRNLPDRAMVFCIPGPFKLSWSLMGGMQNLLFAYSTDESLCLSLAGLITEFVKRVIEEAVKAGADAILLDGDISAHNNTLMSPQHYRLYLKPFHEECIQVAHRHGLPIIKHSDGNFWKVMDDFLEIGFDALHPIQPQCMDIREVKTYVNGRACIIGNIDCAHLLPFGTESEVEDAVRKTILDVAPGGGYVLSSSNSIHPGCKPENVMAMFRAARQYGVYPIQN